MKRLLVLLPLLSACVPAATPSAPRLAADARMVGEDLHLRVTNIGPGTLILENDCPRPFKANLNRMVGFAGTPMRSAPQAFPQVCLTIALPHERWPAGASRTVVLRTQLEAGTVLRPFEYVLHPWAEVRVSWDVRPYAFSTVRVDAPPFRVTLPAPFPQP